MASKGAFIISAWEGGRIGEEDCMGVCGKGGGGGEGGGGGVANVVLRSYHKLWQHYGEKGGALSKTSKIVFY